MHVSKRLIHSVRDVDIVARLGGDEFTVVLTEIKHKKDALLVANKIISSLKEEFIIDNEIITIGASIGISTFPFSAHDSDTLIKQSDTAMYKAKENGKNQAIFYKETDV
jgi:diguanylate cyclase (GGDEF)-like protein